MVTRGETQALESVPECGGPLVELAPGERAAWIGDRKFVGCATREPPGGWCRRALRMRRVRIRRSSANHIRRHGVDQEPRPRSECASGEARTPTSTRTL